MAYAIPIKHYTTASRDRQYVQNYRPKYLLSKFIQLFFHHNFFPNFRISLESYLHKNQHFELHNGKMRTGYKSISKSACLVFNCKCNDMKGCCYWCNIIPLHLKRDLSRASHIKPSSEQQQSRFSHTNAINLYGFESRNFLQSNGENGIPISKCVVTILADAKEFWMKLDRFNEVIICFGCFFCCRCVVVHIVIKS